MNILFVSDLNGDLTKGPNNSVPKQVQAQSKIDNVLWLNLRRSGLAAWHKLDFYREAGGKDASLNELEPPFASPDFIFFEGLYEYPFNRLAVEAMRREIPYVIVPRSAMTDCAQRQKPLKKIVGNTVFFNKFVRKARGIQFLTHAEMSQSSRWATQSAFVVPNGIDLLQHDGLWKREAHEGIKAAYIGRLDIYQKGIDLLLDACLIKQEELRAKDFSLDLYGPDFKGSLPIIEDSIHKAGIGDIVHLRAPVFGEEKRRALLASDVFVMASRFEGFSMGLIEALSLGLPAVASIGTNVAEDIEAAGAGWNAGSSVETLATILSAITPDQLGKRKENAVKFASRYQWNAIARQTHDCLIEMMESKK